MLYPGFRRAGGALADRVATAAQKEEAVLRKNAGAVVKRDPLNKDR